MQRGYQEASIIIDHKTERGIGGGNCQVSSTLYNAVLNIPNLAIIERHEHGKDVTYVPEGKDAAVSFGSLDFKFRNDTQNDIKIEAASKDLNELFSIEQDVNIYKINNDTSITNDNTVKSNTCINCTPLIVIISPFVFIGVY